MIHTKEPWILGAIDRDGDTPISADDWQELATVVTRMHGQTEQCREGAANARRIVACVNALVGWPTETVEKYCTDGQPGNPNLGQVFAELRAQRDELIAYNQTRTDELAASVRQAADLKQQRDELLSALKHLRHNIKATGKRLDLGLAMDAADAAIANAESAK